MNINLIVLHQCVTDMITLMIPRGITITAYLVFYSREENVPNSILTRYMGGSKREICV
jgi:hypothetical protein